MFTQETLDSYAQFILTGSTQSNELNAEFRKRDLTKYYRDLRYDSTLSAATTVAAGNYPLFTTNTTAIGTPSLTTNMNTAGQFPSQTAFFVLGFTVDVIDGATGTAINTADASAVRQGSVFQFMFNSGGPYFTRFVAQMPRSMDPNDYRPPLWLGNIGSLWIPPQTDFSVNINVPTAITITTSSKVKWVASIIGFFVRPLQ